MFNPSAAVLNPSAAVLNPSAVLLLPQQLCLFCLLIGSCTSLHLPLTAGLVVRAPATLGTTQNTGFSATGNHRMRALFYAGVLSCYSCVTIFGIISFCVPGQPSLPAIPKRGEGRGQLPQGAPSQQVSPCIFAHYSLILPSSQFLSGILA